MKLKLLSTLILLSLTSLLFAQIPYANAVDDYFLASYSMSGTSGAGVCYNPNKNLYYAAFTDGEDSPLEVYNKDFEFLYSGPIKANINSIWYNPNTNKLEGILANNKGLFSIDLNEDGIPYQIHFIEQKFNFPGGKQGATYNPKNNEIYYLIEDELIIQSLKNSKRKSLKLISYAPKGFVQSSPVYTGISGYEIALLGAGENRIYLFDIKTGKQKAQVNLSYFYGIPQENFNIGYANNIFFIFNADEYVWSGYTIFK